MANNDYSYDELTSPPILKFRKRMERQLNKAAKALIEALKAETIKHFAHEGKVEDERVYTDHRTRISAADKIVEFAGAKVNKHEVEHTGMVVLSAAEIKKPKNSGKAQ